ncbi:MAG TPA: hypothetical protein VGJ69_03200 [Pyrinomonadaceae bacterium]|jgi:hypothetical protein
MNDLIKQLPQQPSQDFSDDAIHQFLLAELLVDEQTVFEYALFTDASLEPRVRLAELALADDYAWRRLRPRERAAFEERFLVTASRSRQVEVSTALRERFSAHSKSRELPLQSTAGTLFTIKHPAWKWAFAAIVLVVLIGGIWLVTKEPQIVRKFVPPRVRPRAVVTPTPEVTHHAVSSSESPTHKEEPPSSPSHEFATETVVLNSKTPADNATLVTLSQPHAPFVHLQLMLDGADSSRYHAELMTRAGETVYSAEGLVAGAAGDRIDLNVPIGQLTPGDFEVKLTRSSDGASTIYYLRVQ